MTDIFRNKVALVTGAGSEIGRACALKFARHGATTFVADKSGEAGQRTVELIKQTRGEGVFFKCDVGKPKDAKALIHKTIQSTGQLDYACNTADVGSLKNSGDRPANAWTNVLYTDLSRIWLSMKYEIPEMITQGNGVIINVASKHGVLGYTKTAALDHANQPFQIKAVCPGFTYSPTLDRKMVGRRHGFYHPKNALNPVEALNSSDEIASTVMDLCAP